MTQNNNKKRSWFKNTIPAKWLFLFFFTSVWMFVLGIWVGRGIAPVTFDTKTLLKELDTLKQTLIKQEHNKYTLDTNKKNTHKELDFYEELKKSDNLNGYNPQSDLPKRTKAALSKKERPVKKKEWVSKKKEHLNSIARKKNNKHYTIQTASLKDPKSADKLMVDLKKKGYSAYISIARVPEKGTWYRVRIGYFNSRNEAAKTLDRLKKKKISAFVVLR